VTGDGQPARPTSGGDTQPTGGPALKVVAGHPSAEELAALTVAVLAVLAARGGPGGQPGRAASGWADRSRMMGAPLGPGRGAWRRSARPG
jgi:hypothetical protein